MAKNETFCGCFTAPKCQNWDSETTPTLVGGVETVVEVLLKRGPDSGIVSDLPEDRQFPVVASIEDKLFLCGGTNNSGFAKSTCFYYSFVSQKWIELEESLPNGPLSRSAGVAAYGDFYILGGQTSTGEATDKVKHKVLKIRIRTRLNWLFSKKAVQSQVCLVSRLFSLKVVQSQRCSVSRLCKC